jgi:hypothetical protein
MVCITKSNNKYYSRKKGPKPQRRIIHVQNYKDIMFEKKYLFQNHRDIMFEIKYLFQNRKEVLFPFKNTKKYYTNSEPHRKYYSHSKPQRNIFIYL